MIRKIFFACALFILLPQLAMARSCPSAKTFGRLELAPDLTMTGAWPEQDMLSVGYHVDKTLISGAPTTVPKFTLLQMRNWLYTRYGVQLIKTHGGFDQGTGIGDLLVEVYSTQASRDAAMVWYLGNGNGSYDLVAVNVSNSFGSYFAIAVTSTWIAGAYSAANSIVVLNACNSLSSAVGFVGANVVGYSYICTDGAELHDNLTLFDNLVGNNGVDNRALGKAIQGTGFSGVSGDTGKVVAPIIASMNVPMGGFFTNDQSVTVTFDVPMDFNLVDPASLLSTTGPFRVSNVYQLDQQTVSFSLSSIYKGKGKLTIETDSTGIINGGARSFGARIPLMGNSAAGYVGLNGHPGMSNYVQSFESLYGNAAATVEAFSVLPVAGGVQASWITSAENNTAGFILWSADEWTGPWQEVTYLPATGSLSTYTWFDGHPKAKYKLSEVESSPRDTLQLEMAGVSESVVPLTLMEPISLATVPISVQAHHKTPVGNSTQQIPENWDWVAVCPDSFADIAQMVADYWNAHGHHAMVMSLEDAGGINAFPEALRSMQSTLRYVCFIGGHKALRRWNDLQSWPPYHPGYSKDPRFQADPHWNILDMDDQGWMNDPYPSQETGQGAWMSGWPNIQHFVDLNGDSIADFRFGQFPARSRAELRLMIAKSLAADRQQQTGSPTDQTLLLVGGVTAGHNLGYLPGMYAFDLMYSYAPSWMRITKLESSDAQPYTYTQREQMFINGCAALPSLIVDLDTNGNRAKNGWWDKTQPNPFRWSKTIALSTGYPFYLGLNCGQLEDFRPYDPLYGPGVMFEAMVDTLHGPWGGAGFCSGSFIDTNGTLTWAFFDRAYGTGCESAGDALFLAIHDRVRDDPYQKLALTGLTFWGDPLTPLPHQVKKFVDVPTALLVSSLAMTAVSPGYGGTTVMFNLPGTSDVDVSLYDVTGRFVERITTGNMSSGQHRIRWQAPDTVQPGMYFLLLNTGHDVRSQKLVLVR